MMMMSSNLESCGLGFFVEEEREGRGWRGEWEKEGRGGGGKGEDNKKTCI